MWSFNGQDISGTTAYDRSGNGNNGALTNGPTRAIGKVGQALGFDGTDDYILVSRNSAIEPVIVSVATWVKLGVAATSQAAYSKIVEKSHRTSGTAISYDVGSNYSGNGKFFFEASDGSYNAVQSTTIPVAGTWYHVVGVYDGATSNIYINGVLENTVSDTGSITYNSDNLFIGQNGSNGERFNGVVDEVRIYNRALSESEVKQLYNLGK
jgi:hypothetical protein